MTRRVKILLFLLPLAVLLTIPLAFFAFWFAGSAGSDEGSPALATEWPSRLALTESQGSLSEIRISKSSTSPTANGFRSGTRQPRHLATRRMEHWSSRIAAEKPERSWVDTSAALDISKTPSRI